MFGVSRSQQIRSDDTQADVMGSQAEGHRQRGFLVNPKHATKTQSSSYYHLPINNIVLADLDVGSPLTSTVTSLETSALHRATLPHANPACIARIPCASRALPPPRRSRILHHRPRRPSPADSLAKPALVSVFFIEAQGAVMWSGRWLCTPLFFHPSCAVVPTTVGYNPCSREGRRSLQLIALSVSLSLHQEVLVPCLCLAIVEFYCLVPLGRLRSRSIMLHGAYHNRCPG